MTINFPVEGQLSPHEFYMLHVEDEGYDYFRPLVESCLRPYRLEAVRWTLAKNKGEALKALQLINEQAPSGRGFDAILCDLKIPGSPEDDKADAANGLHVATEARKVNPLTIIIGLTAYANDKVVLEAKTEAQNVFDEFLEKRGTGPTAMDEAKLRRWLIPTAYLAQKARDWPQPCFFYQSLWSPLRKLVQIADQEFTSWPLPKILLLGEPGCGKGMFARAYFQLLQEMANSRRTTNITRRGTGPYTVNCASLVGEGEGGRIRLLGYRPRNPNSVTVHVAPGVFETATAYEYRAQGDFAPDDAKPIYAAGGVAFLDEFVTLDEELQPSILNALEEGVIQRQDGSEVKIGCHVVFATNAAAEQREYKLRPDLLGRIPYSIAVPSLLDRREEALDLIRDLARAKLRELSNGTVPLDSFKVSITESARQIIEEAMGSGVITSIRQLQQIASVRKGETEISDGNLQWLLQEIRAQKSSHQTPRKEKSEASFGEKINALQLPNTLRTESIPQSTRDAVTILYRLYGREINCADNEFSRTKTGQEVKRRFYFLVRLLNPNKASELIGKDPPTIRQMLRRVGRGSGVDTKNEDRIIAYLLTENSL